MQRFAFGEVFDSNVNRYRFLHVHRHRHIRRAIYFEAIQPHNTATRLQRDTDASKFISLEGRIVMLLIHDKMVILQTEQMPWLHSVDARHSISVRTKCFARFLSVFELMNHYVPCTMLADDTCLHLPLRLNRDVLFGKVSVFVTLVFSLVSLLLTVKKSCLFAQ